MIFFNEVLFTSYCCVRYFQRRKILLYIFLGFFLSHFSMQKVSTRSTKRKGTLLTIFRPPGYSNQPSPSIIFYTNFQHPCLLEQPPPPFIRDLRVGNCIGEVENSNIFSREWFCRLNFYWGILRGGFSRSNKAGCKF